MTRTLDNPTSQHRQIVDTLRLPDRDLLRLVKIHLKAGVAGSPVAATNDMPPIDLNLLAALPRMLLRLHDNVSNCWTTCLVKPCDIHANGVVCLHGAFVHRGARCGALVRTVDGSPAQIAGTVLHCRHLTGRLHQLVATFAEPIRLAEYSLGDGVSIESLLTACRAGAAGNPLAAPDEA